MAETVSSKKATAQQCAEHLNTVLMRLTCTGQETINNVSALNRLLELANERTNGTTSGDKGTAVEPNTGAST